jgi:hypothetical protein
MGEVPIMASDSGDGKRRKKLERKKESSVVTSGKLLHQSNKTDHHKRKQTDAKQRDSNTNIVHRENNGLLHHPTKMSRGRSKPDTLS